MKHFLVAALALAGCASAFASVDPAMEQKARQAIATINPQAPVDAVLEAPIPGFTTVLSQGEVIYVSNTGTHIFIQGRLYRVRDRFDEGAAALQPHRVRTLAAVPESSYITFKAANERHVVTVFTDIECTYCRAFHSHIAEYNAAGITVRYLSFPRGGVGSEGFTKAVSVWCADDRNAALTAAKTTSDPIPPRTCANNPVEADFKTGIAVGVRGTPAIYAADGRELGGYLDPQKLIEALNAAR